jgi:hypothetical protein
MKMYIFDIDGTLTSTDPRLFQQAGYSTYAYWDLLTFSFVTEPEALQNEIKSWKREVSQLEGQSFISSSADMLQRSLAYLPSTVSEQDIIDKAQEITDNFIEHGVVVRDAISILNDRAEEGHVCVLSTGSYQSGAEGFLNALVSKGLISTSALRNIYVSGAVVDWDNKIVVHANVHNNKIIGLNKLLADKLGLDLPAKKLQGESRKVDITVYADDPKGNDAGILALTSPEKRFVIPHEGSARRDDDEHGYVTKTWQDIVAEEGPESGLKTNLFRKRDRDDDVDTQNAKVEPVKISKCGGS